MSEVTEQPLQAEKILDTLQFMDRLREETKVLTPQSNLGVIVVHDPQGMAENRLSPLLEVIPLEDDKGNIGNLGIISTRPPEEIVRTALRIKGVLPEGNIGVSIYDPGDRLRSEVFTKLTQEAEGAMRESGRQGGKVRVICPPAQLNGLTLDEKAQITSTRKLPS